jgi:predicted metal-binding protein
VSYFGDKLPPTSSVEIYYSAHDVKKDYKVIGHLTCNNLGQTVVKEKLIAYGQKIGADAVVITGTDATKDNQAAYITADALVYNK